MEKVEEQKAPKYIEKTSKLKRKMLTNLYIVFNNLKLKKIIKVFLKIEQRKSFKEYIFLHDTFYFENSRSY